MSRRLLPAALVGACVLLVHGCGGGGDGETSVVAGEPVSLEQLARSADTSATATSGRFAFDLVLAFPGA